METTRWELVNWSCPQCITEYEPEDADVPPPSLSLVDTADHSVDEEDIWGVGDDNDGFNGKLWMESKKMEPVVYCRSCETVFDVTLTPRDNE